MKAQYRSTRYAKFLLNYHFVWCPKYKRAILDNPEVMKIIEESIVEAIEEMGCSITDLEIMPEYIHLSVSALPRFSPARLIGRIKGKSGSRVAARFPELKRRGKIWSNSYFCSTDGQISIENINDILPRLKQWNSEISQ